MLPWCATWARNAWAVFWVILLASSVFDVQREWQNDTFTVMDALIESAELLLWLAPALLWTLVARSATPMAALMGRLRPLVLALGKDTGQNTRLFRKLAESCLQKWLEENDQENCRRCLQAELPPALHAHIAELLNDLP